MSNPVLYYSPGNTSCRAILLTAHTLKIKLDLRLMNGNYTKKFVKFNLLHTIPMLNDNGNIVIGSKIICKYLADKYAVDDTFYPTNPVGRFYVDTYLSYIYGHLMKPINSMIKPVLYDGADSIAKEDIEYMQAGYDSLEEFLISSAFLCGENQTIADLCCVVCIATGMLFVPLEEQKYPNITGWLKRLSKWPHYKLLNEDGARVLYRLVQNKIIENKIAKVAAKCFKANF